MKIISNESVSAKFVDFFFPLRESFTVVLIGGKRRESGFLSEHAD